MLSVRGFFIAIISVLFLCGWTHGEAPPALTCNAGTGTCSGTAPFSFTAATCDGTTDVSAAFTSFNSAAKTWQGSHSGLIELDIPHGVDCHFASGTVETQIANGIKKLRVVGLGYSGQGDGATFSAPSGTSNGWTLGAFRGVFFDNAHSARLATVTAGSSCVSLITSAQSSLFTVGQYVLISGIDMDGQGDPPNPYFYEYPKIASIDAAHQCDGTTVGASVTFTAGLAHTYKSTWPLFYAGDAFHSDEGGPATLYALDVAWDTEIEYRGLTFNWDQQTLSIGRSAIFRNVKSLGGNCPIPSENLSWTVINSDFSNCTNSGNGLEVDKIIGTATIQNSTVYKVQFQSASVDNFYFTSSTATNGIFGTPKNFIGLNSTIAAFQPGATFFGATSSVSCTSCAITTWTVGGVTESNVSTFTVTNGNIHIPATYFTDHGGSNSSVTWGVPGTNLFYDGILAPTTPAFQISDIVRNGDGSVDVSVNSTGLPPSALWTGGVTVPNIGVHPAPTFTCSSCTGGADSLSLAAAPAGAPLGSFAQTTLNATTASYTPFTFWGTLSSVSFNVTSAYTGSALGVNLNGANSNVTVVNAAGTATTTWAPQIDAKSASPALRTVTPTTVTGANGTDNIGAAPGAIFLLGQQPVPRFTSIPVPGDIGSTSVTVKMQTTQGVVPGP